MAEKAAGKIVFDGRTLIDLTDDNVTPESVESGVRFHGPDGKAYVGTASGGGGGSIQPPKMKDVNFIDYDGTVLYSYTLAEAAALSALPELPSHSGLVCQGWNFDLNTIKSYNRAVNVGAMYITDDGKTRLYIRIAAEGRMTVPLYITQTVANGVTIDWGDGSSTQTLSGSGNVNTTHTYSSIGDYIITLDVADGCTLGFGAGTSFYNVMGSTGNNGIVYCNMLQKVEIGERVTSISTYAVSYCYSLASITIPDNVTSIGTYAFHSCYPLASITIPDNVTSIGGSAFYNCYSLASITIPDNVTSIGTSAFYFCYSLASITLPDNVTSIGGGVFRDCRSLASITIPDNVTSIGNGAFYSCYPLASITIPDNVTSIGDNAFRDCRSLASITIPDNVTSIGAYAFYNCYSLASITIPDNVTSIGGSVFYNCYGMAVYDFTSHTSVPTLSGTNAFRGVPSDCVIKVPASLYDEWIAATNWSTYADYIVGV